MVANNTGSPLPCTQNGELFYSPEEDGRTESGRVEREALAGLLCAACPRSLRCLEDALVMNEMYGVWGGMGEGERRRFRQHLTEEGYDLEIPTGRELLAARNSFYRYMETAAEKFHGELESELSAA